MKAENEALKGRQCYVVFEGNRQRGKITDVVESIRKPYDIILYCITLKDGTKLGREKVELIEEY